MEIKNSIWTSKNSVVVQIVLLFGFHLFFMSFLTGLIYKLLLGKLCIFFYYSSYASWCYIKTDRLNLPASSHAAGSQQSMNKSTLIPSLIPNKNVNLESFL